MREAEMSVLPEEFADIEGIAAPWALARYDDRYAKRLASTMEEMQTFYDAVFPRAEAMITYCDRYDMENPPEEAKALLNVLYSLIAVSFAVEVWKQPRVPDTGATGFQAHIEPAV
jgi:hypothetical protein